MTTSQAARNWNISRQRVLVLLRAGRIPGAVLLREPTNKTGRGRGLWSIPDTVKPVANMQHGPKKGSKYKQRVVKPVMRQLALGVWM